MNLEYYDELLLPRHIPLKGNKIKFKEQVIRRKAIF
jgi:hypothetical protein